jgi:hypothetical protein
LIHMKINDFSLDIYAGICKALQAHKTVTVQDYLSEISETPCVILRHDVDRSVKNALAMAELEHKYGIRSTYYFRYPYTYNLKVMKQIYKLGHEIGYHYEVMDKAKGDYKKAIEIFQNELMIFRKNFPVRTVCMHGNPLTRWDGKDIWRVYDFRDFGIVGEAYLSVNENIRYITDTGRNWNNKLNFKDRIKQEIDKGNFRNTTDVIRYINGNKTDKIYINCHPERWGYNIPNWFVSFLRDHLYNFLKLVLKTSGFVSRERFKNEKADSGSCTAYRRR